MQRSTLHGEKLLKQARARAYQRYYLWLITSPEIRAELQVEPLRFKIKK